MRKIFQIQNRTYHGSQTNLDLPHPEAWTDDYADAVWPLENQEQLLRDALACNPSMMEIKVSKNRCHTANKITLHLVYNFIKAFQLKKSQNDHHNLEYKGKIKSGTHLELILSENAKSRCMREEALTFSSTCSNHIIESYNDDKCRSINEVKNHNSNTYQPSIVNLN